jgi:hypothetical protein
LISLFINLLNKKINLIYEKNWVRKSIRIKFN